MLVAAKKARLISGALNIWMGLSMGIYKVEKLTAYVNSEKDLFESRLGKMD